MHIQIWTTGILVLATLFSDAQRTDTPLAEAEWITKYELSDATETVTYDEGIGYYLRLASHFEQVEMYEMGPTDSGLPLHLVLYSKDGSFDLEKARANGKSIVLVNNAIHPGESDGVDASIMMLRDILQGKLLEEEMENVVLAIIPFYNIGGVLNRGKFSRANQNGPKEHGFRGNARNYDLNRDFIKNDTRNARSFAEIFHKLDPDLFIDTHVSNGADYQYVMTLDYAQKDKLGGELMDFQEKTLLPFLYAHMEQYHYEMTPYVNVWGRTPDQGWYQFPDWPRYSSGYAALFHTIGFMSETHMLKSYRQRVEATYALIQGVLLAASEYGEELRAERIRTKESVRTQERFAIKWKVDTSQHTVLPFKGYDSEYRESEVTTGQRLFYDQEKPYTKDVKYYDTYIADVEVTKPSYYVISQGWHHVIELLELNGVRMNPLKHDTSIAVTVYNIADYETSRRAYEGHFRHNNIKLESSQEVMAFRRGDIMIPVDQEVNRYIIETLEPQAEDAFFSWNFFDPILQQKEGYSAYVFEDVAKELLESNDDLRLAFETKKQEDPEFAGNPRAQLYFIYQHSPYMEKEYLRYPVYRIE